MSALSSTTRMRVPGSAGAGGGASGGSPCVLHRAASTTYGRASASRSVDAPAGTGDRLAPAGSTTVKVEPVPGVLSTVTSPSWICTSSRTSARPMPDPSKVRAGVPSTRWNRSKTRDRCSAGIPAPVSATCSTIRPSDSRSRTVMCPSSVNLKALDSRFSTTFSHIARSTTTGPESGGTVHVAARAPPARSADAEVAASSASRRGEVGRFERGVRRARPRSGRSRAGC